MILESGCFDYCTRCPGCPTRRADAAPDHLLQSGRSTERSCVGSPAPLQRAATGNPKSQQLVGSEDLEAKASERARLQQLVCQFLSETSRSAGGRHCAAIALDSSRGLGAKPHRLSGRQVVRYLLVDEATQLEISSKVTSSWRGGVSSWEILGTWPILHTLAVEKAERSALLGLFWPELCPLLAQEELCRSVVIECRELHDGSSGAPAPLLLIEESRDCRDRFVTAIEILQLYRAGAARKQGSGSGYETPGRLPSGRGFLRPPPGTPFSPLTSPFDRKAPAPPPTPKHPTWHEVIPSE
eukprot:TRINITY_DN36349_c0_g1_i1.p1 TRINITY_DN36349_c0_g1~~TRINITY_DN36349_c0_g1_i1.p1  ORF type:complete len:298 (-),score=49.83 TRINITY_DN36349_c0_g1_i1:52-945(-)